MSDQPTTVCKICAGVGKIRVDKDTWKRCYCSFARVFRSRVGVEIASSRDIEESPLFTPGPPELVVDRTKSNLFIKGWWPDLLSHLKFTLLFKHLEYDLHYNALIVTDERLKAVYLGAEAYNNKAKRKRDMENVATYNTLADFIGEDLHLVIIRLGFLGYKNAAMPGILKEALLLRQSLSKPTWLMENPDSLWGPGHRSYSDEVGDYVAQHFDVVDLTQAKDGPVVPRGVVGATLQEDEGMSIDEDDDVPDSKAQTKPVVMPEPRMQARPKDYDFDLLSDNGYKKKGGSNRGGKSGGGPL